MSADQHSSSRGITRRRFEHITFLLIPFVYGAAFLAGAIRYLLPVPGKKRLPRLEVGRAEEFLAGKVGRYEFNDRIVYVLPDPDKKKILAFSARCPHFSCTVNWNDQDEPNRFKCPCHGMKFTRTGEYIEGPTRKDLSPQKMEIRDGVVVLIDEQTEA